MITRAANKIKTFQMVDRASRAIGQQSGPAGNKLRMLEVQCQKTKAMLSGGFRPRIGSMQLMQNLLVNPSMAGRCFSSLPLSHKTKRMSSFKVKTIEAFRKKVLSAEDPMVVVYFDK